MRTKITLDAGHGGYDYGASYNGRNEKDDNLRLALALGRKLQDNGMDVSYTRTTDVYQSPNEKAQMANDNNADLMLSLHRSSSPVPNTYDGVEAYVFDRDPMKQEVTDALINGLQNVGFQDLGTNIRKNMAVLKRTKMPAIVLNIGFVNSDGDNELFDNYFNEIVNAIANALQNTLDDQEEENDDVQLYYHVQAGLFRNYDNAVNLRNQLIEDGYDAFLWPIGGLTAVLIGKYTTLEQAEETEERLRNEGYETIIITI